MKIEKALQLARSNLAGMTDNPFLDAQVLVAHLLRKARSWVMAHPAYELEIGEVEKFTADLNLLATGLPLPYLLGQQEFYGLNISVTPDVLIPRPETELLVETAFRWVEEHPLKIQIADIGVGSGCISAALAAHHPNLRIVATDISYAALLVAKANFQKLGFLNQINLVQCDLLSPFIGRFDLICANLPYIPLSILEGLHVGKFEPWLALDGGEDGLKYLRQLIASAPDYLTPGGALLCEIEASLGRAVLDVSRAVFKHAQINVSPDLAGRDRLLFVQT